MPYPVLPDLPTPASETIADPTTSTRKLKVNSDGSINTSGGGGGGGAVTDLSATGTISAAQPVINTPVSNATVTLTLGTGQSAWKAQLLAGGGGFTSATTIVADKSPDGGTTWYSASFKVSGASPNTPASSIVGPGPLELTGNAAGESMVRIRCSVLNSTETITVTLIGSVGVAEVSILAPLPTGSNTIGSVNVANANANGQATMANSTSVAIASDQSTLPANLKQIGGVTTQMANADGLIPSNVMAMVPYLNSNGGPVDSTGKPQSASLDRLASLQGKVQAGSSANITSTTAGDTSLTFGSAPKTIMPGQKILLSVGTGIAVETVIVANSYTVSSTATSIPLQYPVVNSGSTTAKWDVHGSNGPDGALVTPLDVGVFAIFTQDGNTAGQNGIATNANNDNMSAYRFLEIVPGLYDGNNIQRQRSNMDNIALLASAARTTTQTVADQSNINHRGVMVILDVTSAGTGSVTLEIDMKDPASGKYISLLTGAAVTTNSTNVYTVYPGITVTANVSASQALPHTWRVVTTANNANAVTYSVGASLIV